MARRRFGLDLSAVAWLVQADDFIKLGRSVASITVWDAASGGAQVTDLQTLVGGAITTVSASANGVISFLGPDTSPETVELYLDAGAGERQLVTASDVAVKLRDFATTQFTDTPSHVYYNAGWPASRPVATTRPVVFIGPDAQRTSTPSWAIDGFDLYLGF